LHIKKLVDMQENINAVTCTYRKFSFLFNEEFPIIWLLGYVFAYMFGSCCSGTFSSDDCFNEFGKVVKQVLVLYIKNTATLSKMA
jgi:hypothetical protein